MHHARVSAVIIALCALACTEPEDPCTERWLTDSTQLSTTARTEGGELLLSVQNVSEAVALRAVSLDTLQIGIYSISFRDLSTDLNDGRCGIMIYDSTDAPIAGAALQPDLLLAFVKSTPTDAIDFRTVDGNTGSFELAVTVDSLIITARVGDIVCYESCLRPTSCKVALFVGAALPTGQGRVSARFSEVDFAGSLSWTDSFDCNSLE